MGVLRSRGGGGGLKWDTGNRRVGIRPAEGDGWCACEF